MKILISILALFAITLNTVGQTKVVGIHLLNYNSDEALINLSSDIPGLAKNGINTIFLEVDYNFNFVSHPELIAGDKVITKKGAQTFSKICKDNGIEVIPQFQCLGHQSWAENTGKLLTVYPELDLTPGAFPNNDSIYCREWDVMNPKVNEIVFPLIDEIIEAFDSKGIHVGMDEVFLLGHAKSPSTKGMDPAMLFAKTVNEFHAYFTEKKGKQMYMWGDRFIDAAKYGYGSWEASTNGTHLAIDSVSTDIVICDWHYNTQKVYPSVDLFIDKGFKVLPSSWKDAEAANALIKYSYAKNDSNMLGHMFTTWGAVDKDKLLQFESMTRGTSTIRLEKFHEVFISQGGFSKTGELLVSLKTSNKDIEIRYTMDGSKPNENSPLYTEPFPYLKDKEIKAAPFKGTEMMGSISSKYFTVHLGIGKKVEMITVPSDKYAVEQVEKLLTNGVDFTASYSDGEWLGFEGNDAEFVIDLEEKTKLKTVTINFNNKVNDWVHHPTEVVILGSKDGKSFEVIGSLKKSKTGRNIVTFKIPVDGKVRYVKVVAKNQIIPAGFNGEGNPAWIFIDEVVIE